MPLVELVRAQHHPDVVAVGDQLAATWDPRNPLAPITSFIATADVPSVQRRHAHVARCARRTGD